MFRFIGHVVLIIYMFETEEFLLEVNNEPRICIQKLNASVLQIKLIALSKANVI